MLTHIGKVTETLKTLIDAELRANGAQNFSVSAAPPDGNLAGSRVISVYLFHVMESPDLKNLPAQGGTGRVPSRHQPMGLILQYIVTVVAPDDSDQTDTETIAQQALIGFIARAIHDTPVVSDRTQIEIPGNPIPTLVLNADLRGMGTVLRLNLRPASMEEAVTFWTAQDKNVPRLSLFVEARVVILEAKPPEITPGIVLRVGQFVFTSGEPELVTSGNITFFLPPNAPAESSVQPSPARVALFDNPPTPDLVSQSANVAALVARNAHLLENNRLTLEGTALVPGKRTLLLRGQSETVRIALDQLPAEVPPVNVPWALSATDSVITLRVFEKVIDAEGVARTITPGVYGARVVLLDDRVGLGNPPRPRSTNEISFTIVPQILRVGPTTGGEAATNLYRLRLVGTPLDFRAEISLSVGGRTLTPTTSAPTTGTFRIEFGAAPGPGLDPVPVSTILFRLPFVDPAVATPVPMQPSLAEPLAIRLVVGGATASPEWLTVNAP